MRISKKKMLENLKTRFNIINSENGYCLYDKNREGNYSACGPFVAEVQIDGNRYMYNGQGYTDVEELAKEIDEYIKTLPFNHEFYHPMYRDNIFIELCCDEYLTKLGFKRKMESYGYSNIYEYRNPMTHDIMFLIAIEVDVDKTSGTVIRNMHDYRWMETKFTDLDSAIAGINSLISTDALVSASSGVSVLGKLSEARASSIELNQINWGKLTVQTTNMKNQLIEMLEKELETIRNMK